MTNLTRKAGRSRRGEPRGVGPAADRLSCYGSLTSEASYALMLYPSPAASHSASARQPEIRKTREI
jgi:hypothetical protein